MKKDVFDQKELRGVAKELLIYLDYWGHSKILAQKYECVVFIKDNKERQILDFHFKNTNSRIILVRFGGKYYIREPYNIHYDERFLNSKDKSILESYSFIIDSEAEIDIFDNLLIEEASVGLKKIKENISGICVGKIANTERIADAYVKVYIKSEKTIYYWPIMADLYNINGKLDFELITEFNSAIPHETVTDDNVFLVNRIQEGLCF